MVHLRWLHWYLQVECIVLHIKTVLYSECTSGAGILTKFLEFTSILTWLFMFIMITVWEVWIICNATALVPPGNNALNRLTPSHTRPLHLCMPFPVHFVTHRWSQLALPREKRGDRLYMPHCLPICGGISKRFDGLGEQTQNYQNRRTDVNETSAALLQLLMTLLSTCLANR